MRKDRKLVIRGVGPDAVDAVSQTLQPVSIGDIVIENMPVQIVDADTPPTVDMILGLDFARQPPLTLAAHGQPIRSGP